MRKYKKKSIKALRIVLYELQMFFYSYRLYSEFLHNEKLNYQGVRDNIRNNIFIEVYLLHARILYEFFYLIRKKQDDILIEHFLTKKALKQFKKLRTKKTLIDKIFPWKKVNKRLAHLTYYRLREKIPTVKTWPVGQIYGAMYQTTEAFISSTDDIIKKELFREYSMKNIIKDIFDKNS